MGRKADWIRNHWDMAYKILTAIGIIGALVGLYFLIAQTRSAQEQTRILSEEYRATFRPSLSVENITTQDVKNSFIDILITVKNHGQVPATQVDLEKVIIGGADIEYDQETGSYTFIYTGNGTYVTPLVGQNYPPDLIFFPGKEQLIIVRDAHKPTYETTVSETKMMHLALVYSSGRDQYYYIAKATLQNNTWKVIEHRGN
jgi:hypothetical protein